MFRRGGMFGGGNMPYGGRAQRFGGGSVGGNVGGTTSTVTNDPSMKACRVFIGNLNTLKITKQQVEETFSQYGQVVAVSMHKGYAFVQYMDEMQARTASESEDGKKYAGKQIDCNLASEPKTKQVKKRPITGMGAGEGGWQTGAPPAKQMKVARNLVPLTQSSASRPAAIDISNINKYASLDILHCGNCKEGFNSLQMFVNHKKTPCKLKFTCECRPSDAPETFQCYTCGEEFRTCWNLLRHNQNDHELFIFVEPSSEEQQENGDAKEEGDGVNPEQSEAV